MPHSGKRRRIHFDFDLDNSKNDIWSTRPFAKSNRIEADPKQPGPARSALLSPTHLIIKINCHTCHSAVNVVKLFFLCPQCLGLIYNNEYASFIDIFLYEFFLPFKPWALALQNIWDTLSNISDKPLRFSLIKIEPVSINPSQATLSLLFFSVVYSFY